MAYRNYSDDDKAIALAYYDACQNLKMTARDCKYPLTNVARWIKERDSLPDEVTELVTEKKGSLADELETLAWSLVQAAPARIGDANLTAVMTSLGITVDKMRLLREQPTTIAAQVKSVEERDKKVQEIFERGKLRMAG